MVCPKGMKLMVYQQQAATCIIKKKKTNAAICVVTAMTMVNMIESMYTMEGMILCFFLMSLQCPAGVDKKQLPLMLRICPMEQRMAQAATSNWLNTKIKETMNDKSMPVMEQASHPIILVLYDRSPHKVFSFPKENMLFSSLSPFPSSNAFPIQLLKSNLWTKLIQQERRTLLIKYQFKKE